jgi:hypothetical protein
VKKERLLNTNNSVLTSLVHIAVSVLLCASPSYVWAAPTGYSVQSEGNNHLYRIDLATGVATDLGQIGLGDADGLAFDASGNLYAIGGTIEEFWNITTTPGFLVGNTGDRQGTDAGSDYDPTTGKMYNLQRRSDDARLYVIDITNGVATHIGNDGRPADSLAINASGQAFAATLHVDVPYPMLHSVDLATGDLTEVGPLGIPEPDESESNGMSFDHSTGTLYMLLERGAIYTVNTSTGLATFVANVTLGGNPISGLEGLAISTVPEPTALAPLGLAASASILMLRCRRRAARN